MAEQMTVRHHVDEEGRLYLELDGLCTWIRERKRSRDAAMAEGRSAFGPLLAGEILAQLEKARAEHG